MIRTFIFIVICLSVLATYSQNNSKKLTKNELKATINGITNVLEENYVFPDKVAQISTLLNNNLKKGVYNSEKISRKTYQRFTIYH
ncbi:hypothetical protein [uncultured Tenacibaculum sp.]|uniref:hypothetical protein n=1 Tax=uncultured Tenacibaculum sp. TaxID=174713 RepID=UPI002632F6F7|nr:hypothetical protein [uncultured Tenacibaculum sp.]